MTPLVLVHGFAGSAATWDPLRAQAGPDFCVRTWELPGHGERAADLAPACTLAAAVAGLEEVLAAQPAPPVLVGHSAGGYLALRCAARGTVPLAGLAVIASGPGFRRPEAMVAWNKTIDKLATRAGLPPHVAAVAYMSDSLVIDNLPAITVPVLLVVGAQDRQVYADGAGLMARRLPGARLVRVADAGHNVHVSHAAELARLLRELAGGRA
jgi:pimeloyl-ACP methyl ester carboxylesterase